MKPATATKARKTIFKVKARKNGLVVEQILTSEDQAARWKALVKENGYEVIK